MIHSSVVHVSPEMATEWLNRDRQNRPLRSGQVERFARDMMLNQWQLNGEPIIIATDGTLLDGQHRLYAVIESGRTVPMVVTKGVEANTRGTIDTGVARTFGDVVGMQGVAYPQIVSRSAKLWWWYDHIRPKAPHGAKPSHTDLQKTVGRYPWIVPTAAEVARRTGLAHIAPFGVAAFIYGGAQRFSPEVAAEFLDGLISGANLSATSPIRAYRERALRTLSGDRKFGKDEQIALLMKAWNAYAAGEAIRTLRWQNTEGFPNFYGDKSTERKLNLVRVKAGKKGHGTKVRSARKAG